MDKVIKIIVLIVSFIGFVFLLRWCILKTDIIDLGAGLRYDVQRKDILGRRDDIPPIVLSYKSNKNFIVVKQRPRNGENVIYANYNYSEECDTLYYWIIVKSNETFIGPLTYNEFVDSCHKYSIFDELGSALN